MNPKPTIYFDLDGTLYDLYGVPDWLERITTLSDVDAYTNEDAILVDIVHLHNVLYALMDKGYTIGVVTWLAKGSSKEYDAVVRKAKKEWIAKFLPMASEVHVVKYGTPKHHVINNKTNAIIVDDDASVREAWTRGLTIDATNDILTQLERLIN